jgi:prolyl oligopeptidase
MNYPRTKKKTVKETIFGHEIEDPYRWLENGNSKITQAWIKEQNKYTKNLLGQKSNPKQFRKKLLPYYKVTDFSAPCPVKGKYFYMERKPNENQFALYVKNGINGKPKVLVNPNKLCKDGTASLDYWVVSKEGNYLAYGISKGGTEVSTLSVIAVKSGKQLPEKIPYARYSNPRWLGDESGFFYTKYPKPGTVPKGDEHYYERIYFHRLGENPDSDQLIFVKDRPKEEMHGKVISQDDRYLIIDAALDWNKNDVFIYDRTTKTTKSLIEGYDAKFIPSTTKNKLYLLTNYKANNFRVLVADLNNLPKSVDDWGELITESKYVLNFITFTENKILVAYLKDAYSIVKIFNYKGKHLKDLPLPPFSTIAGIGSRRDEKEFFYGFTNFLTDYIVYRYIPQKDRFIVYRKNTVLPKKDYVVKQDWYSSSDGTKIPIYIFHKKGLKYDGTNPTILYGYGGFSISITPSLPFNWMPLINRGAIFAIANIRGGGEYGEKWHRAGILNKKNK